MFIATLLFVKGSYFICNGPNWWVLVELSSRLVIINVASFFKYNMVINTKDRVVMF